MSAAAIIALILQLEPPVQLAITSLIQKYQASNTVPTAEQIAADLASLDTDIAAFDAA